MSAPLVRARRGIGLNGRPERASRRRSGQTLCEPSRARLGRPELPVAADSSKINEAMPEAAIVANREIMSGTPCFRGTRVPFKNLIDYLEGGHSLEEFLRQFPTVTREMAVQALEEAKESLLARIG